MKKNTDQKLIVFPYVYVEQQQVTLRLMDFWLFLKI